MRKFSAKIRDFNTPGGTRWLGRGAAAFLLALLTGAQGGGSQVEFAGDPFAYGFDLSAPVGRSNDRAFLITCAAIDPSGAGQRLPSSFDRPACAPNTKPALGNREFLKFSESDVAVKLGYVDGPQPGSGLLRLLTSFSHFLTTGPLAGWQVRADAQIGRPPTLAIDNLVDERVKLFLGAKPIAGFNVHFDAIAISQGAFSPAMGADHSLEVAADISRVFIISNWGEAHNVDLRLSEGKKEDRTAGTTEEAARATLGYSHNLGFGSIGADFGLVHVVAGANTGHTEARSELKFFRPF